jgi:hypothetical protein
MTDIDDPDGDQPRAPTPAELMRSWHPDLFSDTERSQTPIVPRAVLDHHLETLTNRKEEDEFEYFARLLAERELCPNLRPQTGPHGGGDSKVDTETYPVAPELALRWYYGEPEAAEERWAFAFSAKKKWKEKVKKDVESIISTGRAYKRIYFITNQYAPDKQRAEAEDALTKVAGVPVTILDRSWILEKVYENNRLELAVRALNMTDFTELVTERKGPRDTARLAELERLDASVSEPGRYDGANYALAEDALESALIARGLERPRTEVEARFLTAARIADQVGHEGQRSRIAYNRAWTAYWWFDDIGQFNDLYDQVAELTLGSDDASDLERTLNLWHLLLPAVAGGRLSSDLGQVEARGAALRSALQRIASNTQRPNNAAKAQTSLLLMRAAELMKEGRPDELPDVWDSLRAVVERVDSLGDYPVERIHELIARAGEYVPESPEFDALYDELVGLLERRRSEAEGGIAYLRRGTQKLEKGFHYDAIRMLGRAETRLIKAEYVEELVETLVAIGEAYNRAGLKWAARAKALIAADRLLSTFAHDGRLDPRASVPLKFLVWLELGLGRVPQVLAASELYRMIINATEQPEQIAAKVPEELQTQDAVLGMLLMRADLNQLRELEHAPDMLEHQGFGMARGSLIWALGGVPAVRRDGFAPEAESDEAIAEFFQLLADQPASQQIPLRPILGEGPELELKTVVLGVEVVARVACNRQSIFLAEAILAALESFLSTSLDVDVFPYRERIQFSVRPDPNPDARPAFQVNDDDRSLAVAHGAGDFAGAADYPAFTSWLQELLIRLSLNMLVIRDPQQWIERVAGDEVGFGRALALSAIAVATRNIFGDEARVLLSDWIDPSAKRYPLERDTPLPSPSGTSSAADRVQSPVRYGQGDPPDIFNTDAAKHTDRRVLSPIDVPLWDRAKWRATGFAWQEVGPPILMLGFEDYEAGKAIFREWRERYGAVDERDALRVSIVRGIDQDDPAAYAVMLSSELEGAELPGTMFYLSSRINRMQPKDTRNLDGFLEAYGRSGSYILAPIPFDPSTPPRITDADLTIQKRRLVVREAWTIGDNEPELSCIDLDEEPIVPEGVTDPPIRRTLERLRRFRNRDEVTE